MIHFRIFVLDNLQLNHQNEIWKCFSTHLSKIFWRFIKLKSKISYCHISEKFKIFEGKMNCTQCCHTSTFNKLFQRIYVSECEIRLQNLNIKSRFLKNNKIFNRKIIFFGQKVTKYANYLKFSKHNMIHTKLLGTLL